METINSLVVNIDFDPGQDAWWSARHGRG